MMGIAMGLLHWYFQNLLVPIVAHWVYDAIVMVWLVKRADSTIT
jgi:membrane protease YdiL (CAAX protease family)